jgi:hypothetical protein
MIALSIWFNIENISLYHFFFFHLNNVMFWNPYTPPFSSTGLASLDNFITNRLLSFVYKTVAMVLNKTTTFLLSVVELWSRYRDERSISRPRRSARRHFFFDPRCAHGIERRRLGVRTLLGGLLHA